MNPTRPIPTGLAALFALFLTSAVASAQSRDEPIPYPEEGSPRTRRNVPVYSKPSRGRPAEAQIEEDDRDVRLHRMDDPYAGIAVEFRLGSLLLDRSRGPGSDGNTSWGLRLSWEFGRMFESESLKDALFMDFTWGYASTGDGTTQIRAEASYHYLTVAPAYLLRFGRHFPLGVFVQAGAGITYVSSSLLSLPALTEDNPNTTRGFWGTLQYGGGLRADPNIGGSVRLVIRGELIRFRRAYMDDTFWGGSVGLAF